MKVRCVHILVKICSKFNSKRFVNNLEIHNATKQHAQRLVNVNDLSTSMTCQHQCDKTDAVNKIHNLQTIPHSYFENLFDCQKLDST